MRSIDGDALREIVENGLRNNPHEDGYARACHRLEYTHFLDVIQRMPTIDPPPNDPLTRRALDMVRAEVERQYTLWGNQNGRSLFEWMSILGEEYGELCEAVNETLLESASHPDRGGLENVVKEATQVATVAVQIIGAAYRRKPEMGAP